MKRKDIYEYDIIVIGGGISGCEASFTSAANGARTLLLSISMDSTGYMAFGNIISDKNGITSVGKKIWNSLVFTRAAKNNMIDNKDPICGVIENNGDKIIVDRKRHMMDIKRIIEYKEDLSTRQGLVTEVSFKNDIYTTITSDGISYKSKAVIIACGTYLDSYIFWGGHSFSAGRPGEITSKRLIINLKIMGFSFEPSTMYAGPKIDGRTLDLKNNGTEKIAYYPAYLEQSCIDYINSTSVNKKYRHNLEYRDHRKSNQAVEEIISGPDKKGKYKVDIVAEGKDTREMYIDGFNTAMDEEIQSSALKLIEGLKNTIITRPGYGIRYNTLSPVQINKKFESKNFPGLYFCGKINGALKYEDSAVQGYIAGMNASRRINNIK